MWRLSLCQLQGWTSSISKQEMDQCPTELRVGSVSMSNVVFMQAGVTTLCSALPCSALVSSHDQWPFCLRWWMREKCSVSTLIFHTVSSPRPALKLSLLPLLSFSHALSPWRSATYTAVMFCSVHVYFWWVLTHRCMCVCGPSVFSQLHVLLAVICRSFHTTLFSFMWLMLGVVLSLCSVGVCVCPLSRPEWRMRS